MNKIKGKNILVVGLGETGFDSAVVLFKNGANVRVTERDNNSAIEEKKKKLLSMGIPVEVGGHSIEFFKSVDIVIPSPGVPLNAKPLIWAKSNNIKILSEIEIAYRLSPSKNIIAITGTNGKTTTVSFADAVFEKAGIPHISCGNIGNSFIGEIDSINQDTWVILEVSSFQLEYIEDFKPVIGVILNIADDHLDYYDNFFQYVEAKRKLFKNLGVNDFAVLNYDNMFCREIGDSLNCRKIFFSSKNRINGVFISEGSIIYNQKEIFSIDDFNKSNLLGIHNLENVMAVSAIAEICGINPDIIKKTLIDFRPHAHRMENIGTINGITFIDDSKATNVDAVYRALECFPEKNNIFLILGGKDKGISFEPLNTLIKGRVKMVFLMGESKHRIKGELAPLGIQMVEVKNFDEAVRISIASGKPGDIVLLSPGCSSFDMFKNYAERGDVFKNTVKNLL